MNFLWRTHEYLTIRHPAWTLIGLLFLLTGAATQIQSFRLDASADSLVLENDEELRYYREINARYQFQDFLAITYRPRQNADIFTQAVLNEIKSLREDLLALEGIDNVLSILNVPLLNSPPLKLGELGDEVRSLETPGVDYALAKREFLESPLYSRLLLSKDGDTTMLLAYLRPDTRYQTLLSEREQLRQAKFTDTLSAQQAQKLDEIELEFSNYQAEYNTRQRTQIEEIRKLLMKYRHGNEIFLGGVPMIVSDMVSFIKSDLVNFGSAIFLFLIITLFITFGKPRWVILPLLCCTLSVIAMISMLGLFKWALTVISANFVALLLIITMSICVHLTVFYRERQARYPELDKSVLVKDTIHFMFQPCLYSVLTTIVAFMSLIVSGIRPVIDFGYIMTTGISLAFLITFILFPTILMLIPQGKSLIETDFTSRLTGKLAGFARRYHYLAIAAAVLIITISLAGISLLKVENRFIDYFKQDTEIYQGMLTIDRKLGGTTPADLILKAASETETGELEIADEDDLLLGDYFRETASGEQDKPSYWLNPAKFEKIKQIHDYFESRRETGKVLSLATIIRLAESLNDDKPLGDLEATLLPRLLPENIRSILLDPYLSDDGNELRFNMRIIDSDKTLERNKFIQEVKHDLHQMGYPDEEFRLTGMLVLYNNMLQSLYESQILTLGAVFLAIMLMFVILFRSFMLAVLGIIPNLTAAGLVLGFMGWRGIPLDIMTITIAAISIGISVDNTIHYIIRFKREFAKDHDYFATVNRCHGSIGKAMYYTSMIIIVGFSILALSNFIPSIYFGLLTGLAMFAALLAALTLLPSLLIVFKPLSAQATAS